MKAVLLIPGQDSQNISPKNGSNFTLAECYELIGCELIEVVYMSNHPSMILIVDEEGKFTNKEFNKTATVLYDNYPDCIVGRAIYCKKSMLK